VFTPDRERGSGGPFARAEVQPNGTYEIHMPDGNGLAPGWYRVTVLALEPPLAVAPGQFSGPPRSLLPQKYGDPDLSGLTCEVKPGQDNAIDFHLD
jgi:hypothetical protein